MLPGAWALVHIAQYRGHYIFPIHRQAGGGDCSFDAQTGFLHIAGNLVSALPYGEQDVGDIAFNASFRHCLLSFDGCSFLFAHALPFQGEAKMIR